MYEAVLPLFPAGVPGGMELVVILLIAVLLFGANKIPKLARSTGQAMGEFQKGREQVEQELQELQEGATLNDDGEIVDQAGNRLDEDGNRIDGGEPVTDTSTSTDSTTTTDSSTSTAAESSTGTTSEETS